MLKKKKKEKKKEEKLFKLFIFNKFMMNLKYIYLAPAGFTMPYNLGICKFIKEHYDLNNYNFIGSSAGAWLSVYMASDMYLSHNFINDYHYNFEKENILYKWHNICPFLISEFPKYINDDKFIKDKRIEISISQFYNNTLTNQLINDYDTLNELLLLCSYSSYIPILSGFSIPKRNNLISFDGYFSKPMFTNRNLILTINNNMYNRKFTFSDVIGKCKINANDLINLGYYDSSINKNMLESHLLQ